MMQKITRAIDAYFTKPLAQTDIYYADARRTVSANGRFVYTSSEQMQPVGKDWELILFDRIGDDLCYAHVGYPNENGYCHEVLAFLKIKSGWKLTAVLQAETDTTYRKVCPESADEVEIFREIEKRLLIYSDAVYDLDADAALTVFTPDCHMIHPVDGERFADVSCDVFRERWSGVPHPKTLGLPKYSRIYHVELIGEYTAVAKIGMAKLNDHFNDYLFCVKENGSWMIAQKLTESVWKNPETINV